MKYTIHLLTNLPALYSFDSIQKYTSGQASLWKIQNVIKNCQLFNLLMNIWVTLLLALLQRVESIPPTALGLPINSHLFQLHSSNSCFSFLTFLDGVERIECWLVANWYFSHKQTVAKGEDIFGSWWWWCRINYCNVDFNPPFLRRSWEWVNIREEMMLNYFYYESFLYCSYLVSIWMEKLSKYSLSFSS